MNEIEKYAFKTFKDIKHIDECDNDFWYARELQIALNYTLWQNFEKIIKKAIISAENSKKMMKFGLLKSISQ